MSFSTFSGLAYPVLLVRKNALFQDNFVAIRPIANNQKDKRRINLFTIKPAGPVLACSIKNK